MDLSALLADLETLILVVNALVGVSPEGYLPGDARVATPLAWGPFPTPPGVATSPASAGRVSRRGRAALSPES